MMGAGESLSLSDAANRYLADSAPEQRSSSPQEIYRFVRWFGGERPLAELTAAEVANYAERLSLSDTDYLKKLEVIRAFLVYTRKKGWCGTNLAVHLKAKKGKPRLPSVSRGGLPETVVLTQPGYAALEAELVTLYDRRLEAIDEIRKAAADKDFRENAPLEAAREQRGQLEGRIKELEATLKAAVIIEQKLEATLKIGVGDSVTLSDVDSGEEMCYRLVSPREVDPSRGMISISSPIGRSLIDQEPGAVVEVVAPAGRLRYQIKRVER